MAATGFDGLRPLGRRIRLARQAHGLTVRQLGELLGISGAMVSNYENDKNQVPPEMVLRLCEVLQQPEAYFYDSPRNSEPDPQRIHFRSLKLGKVSLEYLNARFEWLLDFVTFLEDYVELPPVRIPDLSKADGSRFAQEEIEAAAKAVRDEWGFDDGPLLELTKAAEYYGAVVQSFEYDLEQLDAYSYWSEQHDRPFIWLNTDKNLYTRSRFDIAHELGHMVLHRNLTRSSAADADFKMIEKEAHSFAGALLMPAEPWSRDLAVTDGDVKLANLKALKPKWRTSIGAMISRASALDLIGADDTTRLWKQYNSRGWRRGEPLDDVWPMEQPELLREASRMIAPKGMAYRLTQAYPQSPAVLAQLTGLSPEELKVPAVHLPLQLRHNLPN